MSNDQDSQLFKPWESLAIGTLTVCLSALMVMVFFMVWLTIEKNFIDPPEERFKRICTEHTLDSQSYNQCMIDLYVAEEKSEDL